MTLRSLPNLLTLARLLSAPVAVWLIGEHLMVAAFWLFVVAALTDAIDGALASALNARSVIGAYLDPLADKALLTAVYVSLGLAGYLPSWLVIMVVFRDLAIIGGAILYELAIGNLELRPLAVSKLNTFAQILLAALVLGGHGLAVDVAGLVDIMVAAVAATAILSGVAYALVWGRAAALSGDDPAHGEDPAHGDGPESGDGPPSGNIP